VENDFKRHKDDCNSKHKHDSFDCFADCLKHKKNCCQPFKCFPVPICDDRIQLRLAGLTGNLTFQLFRLKGCELEIEIDCIEQKEKIKGVICNVGTDFVDILQDNKTVTTILINRILRINWTDPACNPCIPVPCPPNPCNNW